MVKIRYTGGRTWLEIVLNRKSYYFSKENDRILDINDQSVINYIFSLDNRSEFEVVMEEKKEEPIYKDKSPVADKKIVKKKSRPKKRSFHG